MSEETNDTLDFDEEDLSPEEEHPVKERGSLAGKLLVALLLILIFTQGVLTYKVMTMSSEQVVVTRGPAPVQKDSVEYETLKKDLMALKKQKEELETVLPGLKYEVSVLIEQAENLKSTVKELEKVKTKEPPKKEEAREPEKTAEPAAEPEKKAAPAPPKAEKADVVKAEAPEKSPPPKAKEKPAAQKEPEKAVPPAKPKYWALHIWSFKSLDNAEKRVREVKQKGVSAYIKLMEVPDKGRWYRVFIGKYKGRDEAEVAGVSLKARGIVEYFKATELD